MKGPKKFQGGHGPSWPPLETPLLVGRLSGTPWKAPHCYHDICIGETKCKKCHSFLSNRIEELTEAFIEGLLTDDGKDANRNEEDASQDLLLDDDDEDEIIGQTTKPIFIDFEGLELFHRELSKKFDSVI